MKRGLKLVALNDVFHYVECPNPGPDEEGIETICRFRLRGRSSGPNPGPDEEGIETKKQNIPCILFLKSEPRPR